LENAAEAAGAGGKILGVTEAVGARVAIEVHDSGPGLSEQAQSSLFQPTISFKKLYAQYCERGMPAHCIRHTAQIRILR